MINCTDMSRWICRSPGFQIHRFTWLILGVSKAHGWTELVVDPDFEGGYLVARKNATAVNMVYFSPRTSSTQKSQDLILLRGAKLTRRAATSPVPGTEQQLSFRRLSKESSSLAFSLAQRNTRRAATALQGAHTHNSTRTDLQATTTVQAKPMLAARKFQSSTTMQCSW